MAACLLIAGVTAEAGAANRADQLVRDALRAGCDGNWQDRESLLVEAMRLDPEQPLARWHKGFINHGRAWVHVDDIDRLLPIRETLIAHREKRDQTRDDIQGHLALAGWCRRHNLLPQEQAHLTRVLQLAPGHTGARRRLGYRMVDGKWVAKQDIWQAATDSAQLREAFAKWRPRLQQIHTALSHRRLARRQNASDALLKIADASAIPVIEAVFLSSPQHALLGLTAIGNMPQYEAATALARQAVISHLPKVRAKAVELMKHRSLDDYAPALLAGLANPVQSRVLVDFVDGRLFYRHLFHQEGRDQNDLSVIDARYAHRAPVVPTGPVLNARTPVPNRLLVLRNPEELAARAVSHAVETAEQREQLRRNRNRLQSNLNRRIISVLASTTGHSELESAEDWWSWWDDENGIVSADKTTNTRYGYTDHVAASSVIGAPTTLTFGHSCFAAGTHVWTALGPEAIDRLRVGDLVLAQSPETGELEFKPVLATTRGSGDAPMLRIDVGKDQIEATEGHPFWVNGQGWSIARKLTTGSSVYALDQPVQIDSTTSGLPADTFNLVVADFHNYFVGSSRILVHDITRRRPTNSAVPGVAKIDSG